MYHNSKSLTVVHFFVTHCSFLRRILLLWQYFSEKETAWMHLYQVIISCKIYPTNFFMRHFTTNENQKIVIDLKYQHCTVTKFYFLERHHGTKALLILYYAIFNLIELVMNIEWKEKRHYIFILSLLWSTIIAFYIYIYNFGIGWNKLADKM